MEPIPEGEFKMPIPFGKDWPHIKGKTLNEIAEMPGGLAMLPILAKWLETKSKFAWVRTAISRYLAVPHIAKILGPSQAQQAERKASIKRMTRDSAQRERLREYGLF